MNHLNNFHTFLNESASQIHLNDMIDQLSRAERDLSLIKDDNAREIKSVLNKVIGDLSQMSVMREFPEKEFMQNLVSSLLRLKEQGKAIPFSKYPDFSQMGGKFSAPLASLQRAIDKAKQILSFTL
jgi:hypothetical protein